MRNNLIFNVLISLTLFFSASAYAEKTISFPDIEPVISMDFQDANLKDILKVFSIQSGLNFIASEGVQDRRITLYLDKIPLKAAMDKLFKANNLSYELDRESNIFIVKDWGKLKTETVTKVFYLKFASVSSSSLKEEMSNTVREKEDVSSGSSGGGGGGGSSGGGGGGSSTSGKWKSEEEAGITKAVKKLLSEYGSIIEDFRTNSIIVTDTPQNMMVISQVIESLDIPVPQVMLEVEILDVSKNVVDKLGFDWANAGSFAIQVISAARHTSFPLSMFAPQDGIDALSRVTSTAAVGSTTQKFTPGEINFPTNLKLIFDYLTTQTDTKFLARPRILTLSNETAEIRIATSESIGITTVTEATSGTTTATPERAETGVILRVAPQVNIDSGQITMFVYPKIAEAVQGNTLTSGSESFRYRDPEERSTKTLVRVKDGETVILGGLIRDELTQVSTKVPFLSDIPFLGAMFRHKGGDNDKNRQRELLVFITPHIVKDIPEAEIKLSQAKKVMLPEREQGPISVANRELAIKSSINNFERKK